MIDNLPNEPIIKSISPHVSSDSTLKSTTASNVNTTSNSGQHGDMGMSSISVADKSGAGSKLIDCQAVVIDPSSANISTTQDACSKATLHAGVIIRPPVPMSSSCSSAFSDIPYVPFVAEPESGMIASGLSAEIIIKFCPLGVGRYYAKLAARFCIITN
jgi:hypothetical protein